MNGEAFGHGAAAPSDIVARLSEIRGSFSEEQELRNAIARALPEAKAEAKVGERERVDFLVELGGVRVGIEAKIKGSRTDVCRQLFRYAECEGIDQLVLVTTRFQHTVRMPFEMNGKPLAVVVLWGAVL